MPDFDIHGGSRFFLPLGAAHLFTYLKDKGYTIMQEDLGAAHYFSSNLCGLIGVKKQIIDLVMDERRLLGYFAGQNRSVIDKLITHCLEEISFDGIDVLFISVRDNDTCSSVMGMLVAKYFKARNKEGIVVAGGEWAQRAFIYDHLDLFCKSGIIDYYVSGYGELAAEKLLQKISGKDISLDEIPGLVRCEGGKSVTIDESEAPVLLCPSFAGFDLERYKWLPPAYLKSAFKENPHSDGVLVIPVKIGHGCPNRCSFCESSQRVGIGFREPGEIVEDLARLVQECRSNYFFFSVDTVNPYKKFISRLCDEILKAKLKICWSACAGFQNLDDPEIFLKMYNAGARRLIFGLETASPRLLKTIGKPLSVIDAANGLRFSHAAGIWTELEIIAGLPHECDDDVKLTTEFIVDNRKYIDGVWLNKFYLSIHSLMVCYPDRYKIKNIRKFYAVSKANAGDREKYVFAFDEVDGLNWQEKEKQIDRSYLEILSVLKKNDIRAGALREELNVIFYLYAHLGDKGKVTRAFRAYRNRVRYWNEAKIRCAQFIYGV